MKDFRLFDITDFIMDEDFIRWVQHRQPVDDAFWNNWLQRYPEKHLLIAEARRMLESLKIEHPAISDDQIELETHKLLQTIKDQPVTETKQPGGLSVMLRHWSTVAAAILLVIAAIRYFSNNRIQPAPEKFAYTSVTAQKHLLEQVNTSDKPIAVTMPDGSIIELAVNSRISYPAKFDDASRDVYLNGEGYFKVVRDPSHPFRVFANEIVTKVLGTSFIIRSFDKDSTIQVLVKTGKVNVYSQRGHDDNTILTPNQQLIYDKAGQKFQKILQKNPAMIVQENVDRNMLYEDKSLIEVFDQIAKAYGVSVVYDSDLLKKCTLTADLRNEPFYTKLDLICRAVGAKYEIIDGQVVIQSAGCQ